MRLFTKVTFGLFLILYAMLGSLAFGQASNTIQGRVIDATTQEPIAGATVAVIGGEIRSSSDAEGRFSLTGVPNNARLRVSYIGYDNKEVIAQSGNMTISMSASTNALEDVVVIGYGSVKRKDFTTAIATV